MQWRMTMLATLVLGLPFLPFAERLVQAQWPVGRAERTVREPREQSIWMRQKITASQQILEEFYMI